MRVLLTGGSGMVGRNIREHEGSEDHEILAPSSSDLNLLNFEVVRDFLASAKPDVVIHAAGRVGGIAANIASPYQFAFENLQMGINLIEGARQTGIKRFLNIASSCMYPREAANPLSVDQILSGPLEPTNEGYGLAKVSVARLCTYLSRVDESYLYRTIIPCNLYGRFDTFDTASSHLVPAVIVKILAAVESNQPSVDIWGDGTARREFMFSSDMANFVYFALQRFDDLPSIMNVGVGKDHSINDYYSEVGRQVGFEGSFEFDLTKPVGMKQKLVDVSVQQQLGWQPQTSLQDGLRETIEYYKGI